MTYADLVAGIQGFLKNATFGEDNDGQIIVYTNLREVQDSNELIEFEA